MPASAQYAVTPRTAALYGAGAGFVGTVILTLFARAGPDLSTAWRRSAATAVRVPEARQETVIAGRNRPRQAGQSEGAGGEHAAAVTPAGALAEASGPGPEGAAELFAAKLMSGLFDRDISGLAKPAGKLVHFLYGTSWGVAYGIEQGRHRRNPWLAGTLHGLFVWSFGPGSLVPAMRLMLPPWKSPKRQTVLMIMGHIIYGLTVGELFDAQVSGRR